MSLEQRNLTWTVILLFLADALCNTWRVEYQQQHICAVKGSSVVMPCSFYHPDNVRVKNIVWGHVKSKPLKGCWISSSNWRKGTTRFRYIGDKHHNCSLKIHQVKSNDSGNYIIRFNDKISRQPGNGLSLKVVDLKVFVTKPHRNGTIKEGDSVNLTCMNSCDSGNFSSAFTWFKDREPIHKGPMLNLSNISFTNSGNYTCSLTRHKRTTSGVININVEYGPKNTSVSVRQVDTGISITLICSSHANPSVENYTWFKVVADDVVDVGHQPVFLCGESGHYLCSVANKHGSQNSSVVTLKIQSCWAASTRDILFIAIVAAVAMLLIVITVIAIRRDSKRRTWAPNTDCEEESQNTDYINWLICDSDQSQEDNQCEAGATELVYASVCFHNKRQSNIREQQMDSCNDEVIYSTVCRNQLLNPSHPESP
ncbi:B-cell receptor CD22 isoform X1 [Lates calcarifer]|uniref:B-cell receptor CD22 isoform X1 n=1 Tax=Lates calcarifer TaxID=8187 RepID=A0AAJ8DT39_LATCA|nr:B-cell receptor CD22 isoform X1 [Lates calcarifer]